VLGSGGMGLVLAATHLGLRERVALKFMNAESVSHPDAAARFVREARAAARLKGEHVCRVLDMGETETGDRYIVIEHLEGRDLAEVLAERGSLGVTEAVEYVLQACEAMAEAHAAGIIHRDLKPANLFLTTGTDGAPCIKVLDFGISKILDPGTAAVVTTTRSMMGSPLYMAPEQLVSARDVDPRADIWSLGTVLFQLLTGETPYRGSSLPEVVAQVLHTDPPRLSRRLPGAPRALDAALTRCLQRDPARRYQSVAELAADLAEVVPEASHLALRSAAVLGLRPSRSLTIKPPPRRGIVPIVVSAALVVTFAGVSLLVFGGGDGDAEREAETEPAAAPVTEGEAAPEPEPPEAPAATVTVPAIDAAVEEAPAIAPKRERRRSRSRPAKKVRREREKTKKIDLLEPDLGTPAPAPAKNRRKGTSDVIEPDL
jgi:serine/threonine-protein kinase